MEDFANLLHRDYGLKPGGKSAPMSGGSHHSRAGSSGGAGMGQRSGSATRMATDDVFSSVFTSSPSVNGGNGRCVHLCARGARGIKALAVFG